MKKSLWKGLGATDLSIVLIAIVIVGIVVISRYDNFKCRAMESEAKFSLQQIYAAQLRFHAEFDHYATVERLLITDRRVVLPQNYYSFSDGLPPTDDSFLIIASGRPETQVRDEIWSMDHEKNLKIIHSSCQLK